MKNTNLFFKKGDNIKQNMYNRLNHKISVHVG